MKIGTIVRRFLIPRLLITLWGYLKYGCLISPKAEVEITSRLAIGRGSIINSFTKIKSAEGPLRIGRNVEISNGCVISSFTAGTFIGDDCLVGPNCSIIGTNYHYDRLDVPIRLQGKFSAKGIRIADNVWLGSGCVVLDGADIGAGTIVTPNSVISGRIPPNSIATGNPAKVIFTRR